MILFRMQNSSNNGKKSTWDLVLKIIIAVAGAIAGAIGTTI